MNISELFQNDKIMKEPMDLNKTENIWIISYDEGGDTLVDILSHEFPNQSEVLDMVREEYQYHIECPPTGIYSISGTPWSSYDEWSGEYDAGFDVTSEKKIFGSDKKYLECGIGGVKILFFAWKGGDNYILNYNYEFYDMETESVDSILKLVYEFNPEVDGVYMFTSRPSGYNKNMTWYSLVEKIDVPEGAEEW